jgi:DNA polymerase-3 subunit delta
VPGLGHAALNQQIAERRLHPIYLLVGEDLKLIDRTVDAIEATVDPSDRPFAVERLYAGDAGGTPVEIAASARMLPMLGDRRIVVVLRAERLLKPRRTSRTAPDPEEDGGGTDQVADAAALEEYLEAPVSSNTLVFVATDIDRSRRLTKRMLSTAFVVEFRGLAADAGAAEREGRRLPAEWLREELARSGRTIDADAVRLLVSRAGHDISKLRGDVERLLLFTAGRERISSDDVMEVVSQANAVDDEWGVVNAIAGGDPARALVEVGRRMERGDSPHALVGQLRWWVAARLAEGDPGRVPAALDALLRTDLALKSSGGEDRVLLERLVVELTGRALPERRWR